MPSVLPDAVVTNAATPVIINVLANDTGTGLTITSFSNPANGSLVFNGDKTFTYTPMAGFVGDDSFAYTARDAQGTPANAEVTISVVPNTGATIATDDVVEVIAGAGVVIPVLANDMTAGSGALQIIAVSMPGHGAINVLPDQTIRYVPQSGFSGIDSFNYTVVDGQGRSATASVTVKVLTENRPPIAGGDSFTIEAGQPAVLVVLANDSDPEGGPLQVVGFTMPSQGSLVFNPDKTFTYTPAAGYLGNDQFTYTIRDNRGASAQASVSLSIREIIEAPTAADDIVTTEAGAAVTIDVLANDTLPAGQQAAIVAVTLPYRGKLTFNPDKTIIYLPDPGFVGTDDFTYTISNGKGGTAKAKVTIEVTPASTANGYANGYAYRRRIVLPAQGASETTVDDTVVLFAEEASWLKAVANGGNLISTEGADLRFELTDGSKLDHEIESYDPVSGKLLAWIRLPQWTLSSQLQLLLYYGNPLLDGSEANPAGVWQGYLTRWRFPDGSDATGGGRNLVAEGVAAGSLLGDAARFDGDGNLMIADTNWLADLSAITVQVLVDPDASMVGTTNGIVVQGSPDSNSAPEGVMIRYLANTSTGATNVIHVRVGCQDGNAFMLSRAQRQTDKRQLIHGTWLAGSAPDLFLDGIKETPSRSVSRSGATSVSGPLYIGAGWQGLIDEVRIAGRALPADWIAVEARNMLNPGLSYGLGHEETIDTVDLPPIAVPFAVSTTSGKRVDTDVLAQAVDPGGAGDLLLTSVTQPAHGIATVVNNAVRYTPNADFVGNDQFTYTISNGANSASGWIAVTVTAANSAPQADTGVALPAAQHTVPVSNQTELNAALAESSPGDHIVLANGNYAGFSVTRSGTTQNPIVIRAANVLGASITSGTTYIAANNITVYGLDFNGRNLVGGRNSGGSNTQAANMKLWRCRWRDGSGIAVRCYNCPDPDFAYCQSGPEWTGRAYLVSYQNGTRRPVWRYCLARDTPEGYRNGDGEFIHCGDNGSPGGPDDPMNALVYRCRGNDWSTDGEFISIKNSFNTIRQCVLENSRAQFNLRFGTNNTIEACWSKNSLGIGVRDGCNIGGAGKQNKVLGCLVEGTHPNGTPAIEIRAGDEDPCSHPSTPYANAAGEAVVSGCTGLVRVGVQPSDTASQPIRARGTRIRQHSGTISLLHQTGTDSQPGVTETVYSWDDRIWLSDTDVGPFADL